MQVKGRKSFGCLTVAICSVVVAIFAVALIASANPLNRAAIFNQSGHISSGEFIGINIGMNESDVVNKIRNYSPKVDLVGPNADNRCFDIKLHGDQFIQIYDESWRGGTICVSFVGGKATSIAWKFNSFAI